VPRRRGYRGSDSKDLHEALKIIEEELFRLDEEPYLDFAKQRTRKPKRKLSAWNKYVKANSKKPRFRLRSGSPNLKKLAVAFRKTPAGKKKRR
jgi:hypothetical protein